MRRRDFIGSALSAGLLYTSPIAEALSSGSEDAPAAGAPNRSAAPAPMALGLLIKPSHGPEETISRVKRLGLSTCFLSLDDYIGKFTKELAQDLQGLLHKYELTATTAEVVGPGPLKWDFVDGPSTIGIVPKATRAARMDALKQTSDFAKMLGIAHVQTHSGFIPENPTDPLFQSPSLAILHLTAHFPPNRQPFLIAPVPTTP